MNFATWSVIVVAAGAALGCADDAGDPSEVNGEVALALRPAEDFHVLLGNCVESIGVTSIATEAATALMPEAFVPVGIGTPVTPLVVRTSKCRSISVRGKPGRAGSVVQLGAVIVPPDGTGDINNYVFSYYSDDARLVDALSEAGLPVGKADIAYRLGPTDGGNAELKVSVEPRASVPFRLTGAVTPVTEPAGSFLANWWLETARGTLRLSTNVPVIAIGGADLTLKAPAGSELAELVGAGSSGFPILQQFNSFASADLHVSLSK